MKANRLVIPAIFTFWWWRNGVWPALAFSLLLVLSVRANWSSAPSRAALDIDDVAGETDQDWCESCAPFPENHLSDGGGCGSESVVPDDFGTDWTAQIRSGIWMKEK